MPTGFRTFNDQCPIHIRILTMFTLTGIFRVKSGGRFMVACVAGAKRGGRGGGGKARKRGKGRERLL